MNSCFPNHHHPSPQDCLAILDILNPITKIESSIIQSPNTKRRVRFSLHPSFRVSDQSLDTLDLHYLWYQQKELVAFKKQARKLLKSHIGKENAAKIDFINQEMLRGLESCTLERQSHRHKTIQCTLSAYKKGMSIDKIAKIAKVCAKWNEEIAFLQACHDYANVYQPNMTSRIPKLSNVPPEFPFALKRAKSRTNNTAYYNKRRVRRRML